MEPNSIPDPKNDPTAEAEANLLGEALENRHREEAEARRRAEVAARIKKQAEESARRRAEEDKLWEEAMAKRRAEKMRRVVEGLEVTSNSSSSSSSKKTTVSDRRRRREERRLKKELEARNLERKKNKTKATTSNLRQTEDQGQEKNTKVNKKVLVGSLIAILAIAVIWTLSTRNSGAENAIPTLVDTETVVGSGSDSAENNTQQAAEVDNFLKLKVGDTHEGGIIFSIDHASRSGKIAHLKDAGPMPWQDAIEIHEQLGEGWRLPSLEELEAMYKTIGQGAENIGEFTTSLYWSSTHYDDFQASLLRFWDGNNTYHYNRFVEERKFRVRAVRDFKP